MDEGRKEGRKEGRNERTNYLNMMGDAVSASAPNKASCGSDTRFP